jgi:hypothetical protein
MVQPLWGHQYSGVRIDDDSAIAGGADETVMIPAVPKINSNVIKADARRWVRPLFV